MNKSIKKILVTGASLIMLASVGAGMNNIAHNVHASRIYLDQYASRWERRDGITHWGVYAKRGFYISRTRGPVARYYARTFRKNGHTFIVKAVHDSPGEIIGMDGSTHVSNSRVRRALAPHHYRHRAHKYVHRHARRHVIRRARRHGHRRHR